MRGWRYSEERAETFAQNLQKCMESQKKGDDDFDPDNLTRSIARACNLTFVKKGANARGKQVVY